MKESVSPRYEGLRGTLRFIEDLCYDYDGCKSEETLKGLIDEIGEIARDNSNEAEVGKCR